MFQEIVNPAPGYIIDDKVNIDTQFDFQNSDLDTSFKLSNTLQNKIDDILKKAKVKVSNLKIPQKAIVDIANDVLYSDSKIATEDIYIDNSLRDMLYPNEPIYFPQPSTDDRKDFGGDELKRIQLIKKAAQNMKETISTKYQLAPETIEKRSLNPNDSKYFQENYDFMRIKKIENNQMRNDKYNQKIDRKKRTLRDPLNLDEKVLVLAERLKKKDAPGNLYKASTDNIPFFNRNRIFTIYKRAKLENGTYLYWVEEDGKKIKDRFLRQELFALNKQFVK